MLKLIKLEAIGLVISIFSLLIAYIYFDLVKELAPCTLCVLDRFLFFGIIIVFLISIITKRKYFHKSLYSFNLILCLIGLASTIRHIWLQTFQDKSLIDGFGCGGDFFYYISTLPFFEAAKNIFDNPTPCNDIKWQLFGLSIPMYTFLLFILLTIITIKILPKGKYD
ncbi:MAG: disulfide bond formation protein B [Gammaproteobacteria bacterium]|jgi:protein dithiol:quinone oxidoreductase|nr:disulfide bond formation protein B [Gammaproteobacteria bacterium]